MQASRKVRRADLPVVVEHAQGPELRRVDVPGRQGLLGCLAELARDGPEGVSQRLVGARLIAARLISARLVWASRAAAGPGPAGRLTARDHGNSLPATTVVPSY